jgi:hypothetical protein
MASTNIIELIVQLKDQASAALKNAFSGIRQDIQQTAQATSTLQSQFSGLAGALGGVAAAMTIKKAFQEGIQVVDSFKLQTIGVAATLTDMSKKASKDLKGVYENNLRYAEDTYQRVELAAAKYFASGKEMTQAWQILTQKGVIVWSDQDIDNLGIITDKIKLATQGQASGVQIAQELRGVMNGQARATDQIAMLLRDQLGPSWKDQLQTAREEGRVLEFLAGQFKGLKYASGDVEKTLESQKSTLGTLLSQVARGGLAGAYEDIVGIVREINQYLTTHKDLVANQIAQAWTSVRVVIFEVRDGIKGLENCG